MKEGDELVKQVCRNVAKEQGGTVHEHRERELPRGQKEPGEDLTGSSTEERDASGMGHAYGEWRDRVDD